MLRPVDRGFPEDGILALSALDTAGWLFATVDPVRLETARMQGAVRNHRDWSDQPPRCRVYPLV